MSGPPQMTCPTCGKRFPAPASAALPFCSERCRQIDLRRWLNEEQGLPLEPEDREEAGGDRGNGDG